MSGRSQCPVRHNISQDLTDSDQLRDEIREVFPSIVFHGLVTPCDCEECWGYRTALSEKSWDQIPRSFVTRTCSPALLTREAFVAFLPIYLLGALDDLSEHNTVLEFTVYCLSPHAPREPHEVPKNSKRLRAYAKAMTNEQIQAVRHFLMYVGANASNSDWFKPFIQVAMDLVWHSEALQ